MTKILIIEDDNTMRSILSKVFIDEEYDVVEAADGEEGLAKSLSENPNVILLDLILPKINGMEVLKKLRASGDFGRNVPVIILSNLDPDEKIAWEGSGLKTSAYLVKVSVSPRQILDTVQNVLAKVK